MSNIQSLIEAEAHIDILLPTWEKFAARFYLNNLYSRNNSITLEDPKELIEERYNGLTRYLACDHIHKLYELPQERWLTIALDIISQTRTRRMMLVQEAYWAMSNLYTPTLRKYENCKEKLRVFSIDSLTREAYAYECKFKCK